MTPRILFSSFQQLFISVLVLWRTFWADTASRPSTSPLKTSLVPKRGGGYPNPQLYITHEQNETFLAQLQQTFNGKVKVSPLCVLIILNRFQMTMGFHSMLTLLVCLTVWIRIWVDACGRISYVVEAIPKWDEKTFLLPFGQSDENFIWSRGSSCSSCCSLLYTDRASTTTRGM